MIIHGPPCNEETHLSLTKHKVEMHLKTGNHDPHNLDTGSLKSRARDKHLL